MCLCGLLCELFCLFVFFQIQVLILGPNCHCFCVRSGSVSGSLGAVQSLSVHREHRDSLARSVPCSWGAAAFLAPGRMVNHGLSPVLLAPWVLAVFVGAVEAGGAGVCPTGCSAPLALPWNVCQPVSSQGWFAAPGLTSSAVGRGSPSQLLGVPTLGCGCALPSGLSLCLVEHLLMPFHILP